MGPGPFAGFQRLALEPVDHGPAVEPRTLATFYPANEREAWEATAGTARFPEPVADAAPGALPLILEGPEWQKRITRRGGLHAALLNEVELVVACTQPLRAIVVFRSQDGRVIADSHETDVPSSDLPRRVVVPLARPLRECAFESLELRLAGKVPRIDVHSVALVARPPSAFAPQTPSAELYLQGGEGRRGSLVARNRALRAEIVVPHDAVLTFSYLQPQEMRTGSVKSFLELAIRDENDDETTRSFKLEGGSKGDSAWHSARVPLGKHAGNQTRIEFSATAGDGEDVACVIADVGIALERPEVPSVLLVTSDTHREDALGARGAGVRTPALDALAKRGVTFSDCFSSSNITTPSHIALLTGESPRDTGVTDNKTPLSGTALTLSERFGELGFRTWAAVSVQHLNDAFSGLGQGFDRMDGPNPADERRAADTVAQALQWLDEADPGPVFLWVHVFDAHSPYKPPEGFDRMYYPKDRDPNDPSLPEPPFPERVLVVPALQGLRDPEFPRAQYLAEVTYLDSRLAKLFELPRFKNGIVAFVADHGESLGEHNIYFGHAGLYPETIHIPLILAWRGAPAGTRATRAVIHTDLGRTLLDLVGAKDLPFPGRDLLSSLGAPAEEGAQLAEPETRYAIGAHRLDASITKGQYHLILALTSHEEQDARVGERLKHMVELYDLEHDPGCLVNLVHKRRKVAKELRRELVRWLGERRELGWAGSASQDPQFLADLAKLGYTAADPVPSEPLFVDDDCDWCRLLR